MSLAVILLTLRPATHKNSQRRKIIHDIPGMRPLLESKERSIDLGEHVCWSLPIKLNWKDFFRLFR